jgi:hypothetical protein
MEESVTTKAINEAIGINGAYLPARFVGGDANARVSRARSKAGVLQFRLVSYNPSLDRWVNAPEGWELFSGSNCRTVAKHDW